MKSKAKRVTRKEKINLAKKEEEKSFREREEARSFIRKKLVDYGGLGLIEFARQEQDALVTMAIMRPKYDVMRMNVDEFRALLTLVFHSGPISVNNYLAYQVVLYLKDIQLRPHMDIDDYENAVETAPPMLKHFVNRYAKRGLKGALYTMRYRLGCMDGDISNSRKYGCVKWQVAISSSYILYNILYILDENVENYDFLHPDGLASPYLNYWGLFPYEILKFKFEPPFPFYHYEWQMLKAGRCGMAQIIYNILQHAIYSNWKKQCKRAIVLRKLWIAHLQLSDRISRLVEKLDKTNTKAIEIRVYRDKKFK